MTRTLGLIGGGYWGKNLIREFNEINFLHTVCEINLNAINEYRKQYPHLNFTTEWSQLLNSDQITAICVSLPVEMHYKFAKEALLANKDVYVEKPITLDINEAAELVEIAKEKNKILMVGHILHYHPAIRKIKQLANSYGKIIQIVANRFNIGIFRTNENVLWSFAPHDISIILSLCGNQLPQTVACYGNATITKNIHDITNSILQFDNGIYANINVNWLNPYKEQKMTIICEKAMILFDDMEKYDKIKIYESYFKKQLSPLVAIANKVEPIIIDLSSDSNSNSNKSPLYYECMHFMECCATRQKPLTDGEEGLAVLTVLDGLTQSLNNNNCKINLNSNSPINSPINYFVHPTSCVDPGAQIGTNTKIWHYSHICAGAKIGKNCNIGQNVYIGDGAIIGDYCKVQNNVSIYAGIEAKDYVFFGPSCVLTNDINPRGMHSKKGQYIKTILDEGVTLGANCTIVCGNTLGKHALIGSGAVVTKDVDPYSIVVGNPAKKIGIIDEQGKRIIFDRD